MLTEGLYGRPSRVTLSSPSSIRDQNPYATDRVCTLGWRDKASSKRLRVRRSATSTLIRLLDDDMGGGVTLQVTSPGIPMRPDDKNAAAAWAVDTAAECIGVLLGALEWSSAPETPHLEGTMAWRMGAVLRHREGHRTPMSHLRLRTPWDEAAFGEEHDDMRPLPEDADAHLKAILPPCVSIEHTERRISVRSDPASIRIYPCSFGVTSIGLDDPVAVMREMASWRKP
jgi:hypothetical protein